MAYAYATQDITSKMAKCVKTSQPISHKQASEIGRFIKGMTVVDALAHLEAVARIEKAQPFTRFNDNVGHKKGIGPGRYPVEAAKVFIQAVKLATANAINQSLDDKKLYVYSVVAQKGPKTYKYSRVRGIKAKNTHLEVVVIEQEAPVKKTVAKSKSNARKPAAKPAAQ